MNYSKNDLPQIVKEKRINHLNMLIGKQLLIAKLLLEHGASLLDVVKIGYANIEKKMTVFQLAIENAHPILLRLFFIFALKMAEQGRNEELAHIVTTNFDCNMPIDNNKKTALILACEKNQLNIARILITSRTNVNCKDEYGATALAFAVKNNNILLIRLLLTNGADVNVKDKYGRTPLMHAVDGKFIEAAALLLAYNANPDLRNRNNTCLMRAVYLNDCAMAKLLLAYGANVYATGFRKETRYKTAITIAEESNNQEMIELLQEDKANVDNLVFSRISYLMRIILESDACSVQYDIKNKKIIFLLSQQGKKPGRRQLPILAYILGDRTLEGWDAFYVRYHQEELLVDFSGQENQNFDTFNSADEIANRLLTYLLETLLTSAENETYYKENAARIDPRQSASYKRPIDARPVSIGLGATRACNLLIPDRLPNYRIKAEITPELWVKISATGNNVQIEKLRNYLASALGINRSDVKLKDQHILIQRNVDNILHNLKHLRINYHGTMHLDESGNIAIAEKKYRHKSGGFNTAGGHNSDPYHIRYGACVESLEEFNFTINNPEALLVMRSFNNQATLLARAECYQGSFKAEEKEFRPGTERFISLREIREEHLPLSTGAFTIFDYLIFAKNTLVYLLKNKMDLKNLQVNIINDCQEQENKDGVMVMVPGQLFGMINIKGESSELKRLIACLNMNEINFSKNTDGIWIADINPQKLIDILAKTKREIFEPRLFQPSPQPEIRDQLGALDLSTTQIPKNMPVINSQ